MLGGLDNIKNISHQLYDKQLPPDTNAAYYGCKNDFTTPHVTTCVDGRKSDEEIERAFQKQLNLNEAYKSPKIFEAIKRTFMDETLGQLEKNQEVEDYTEDPPVPTPVKARLPVDPRDFMGNIKESFGITKKNKWLFFAILACIIIYMIFMLC